jgi:hypothetical protein
MNVPSIYGIIEKDESAMPNREDKLGTVSR